VDAGFSLPDGKTPEILGLYDMVRAIEYAATDTFVKGIYLLARNNANGYAATTELTNALLEYKRSGKFILASGDYIGQRAYELSVLADEIYCSPMGMVDWNGYGLEVLFFKNTFDKLEIKPEIFYAGKFKSATEPYRLDKMSDANRLQLTTFLEDHYSDFLTLVAKMRGGDTAQWRKYSRDLTIRNGSLALEKGLVTGLKHDDEIRENIMKRVGQSSIDKINFMPVGDYIKAGKWKKGKGSDKISIIYAEGEIVDGRGRDGEIGGDKFRSLIRKARLDKNVKAIVLRVNSPGGSVLASEAIKREVELAKKDKPVVVSMGNYAASGGYYISCAADSIFAQPNTLTGSIGVFWMLFDASKLMKNKLGITVDEVTTAPGATLGSPFRPLTSQERIFLQEDIDSVYLKFKQIVAGARGLPLDSVEAIAQGRIWSGKRAVVLGLADKIGGMKDAVACAARMAKLKEYNVREYPEVQNIWQKLTGGENDEKMSAALMANSPAGEEYLRFWTYFQRLKSWSGVPQMRLPFFINN
jgi:protease IV